jgi:uncharacterized protein YcbK (DUF882 family)
MNLQLTEHFKYSELVCPCCQGIRLVTEFHSCMELLETMRQRLGFAILINSGYRCPEHNASVGGEAASMHMTFAVDCRPESIPGESIGVFEGKLDTMHRAARALGFGGIGRYDSWLHLDTRSGFIARWDNRRKSTNAV